MSRFSCPTTILSTPIKLETVMSTVNLALSSPPVTPDALATSKAYLFLLAPPKSAKEKIVGCAIAQSIETALNVVDEKDASGSSLIFVDRGVFCQYV
jgi:N-acetyltransferase